MSLKKIINGVVLLRRSGPIAFTKQAFYQATDFVAEKWLGVKTGGYYTKAELGIEHPDSIEYAAIWYVAVYRLLRSLPTDFRNSTFVDYGCGKGRVVLVAATFPFRRVVGVEIADSLAAMATENVWRMKGRRAGTVEVMQMDAAEFEVPLDANVIYFYNPFAGRLLEQVVENIHASFTKRPRRLHIVYINDDHFELIVRGQSWLACTRRLRFHPNLECGIYETKSTGRQANRK